MESGMFQIGIIVIELILSGFAVVLWTILRDVKKTGEKAVEDHALLSRELDGYKLHVAERYVTSEFLKQSIDTLSKALESVRDAVFKKLDRIDEKLDGKADKTRGG